MRVPTHWGLCVSYRFIGFRDLGFLAFGAVRFTGLGIRALATKDLGLSLSNERKTQLGSP